MARAGAVPVRGHDAAGHGWLNDIIAIGEGSIDPDRGLLAMRYYVCTADYLPGTEARADQ